MSEGPYFKDRTLSVRRLGGIKVKFLFWANSMSGLIDMTALADSKYTKIIGKKF